MRQISLRHLPLRPTQELDWTSCWRRCEVWALTIPSPLQVLVLVPVQPAFSKHSLAVAWCHCACATVYLVSVMAPPVTSVVPVLEVEAEVENQSTMSTVIAAAVTVVATAVMITIQSLSLVRHCRFLHIGRWTDVHQPVRLRLLNNRVVIQGDILLMMMRRLRADCKVLAVSRGACGVSRSTDM